MALAEKLMNELILSINRARMTASDTAFGSLAAEGLIVSLYSATFSETVYKLFKTDAFFFLP